MFVILNDVPESWGGKKDEYPVYDTNTLEVENLKRDEIIKRIKKFGKDAFSDNVRGDGNGDYTIDCRTNVYGIPIDALDWMINDYEVTYKGYKVSLEVDGNLDLVYKINGKSYILAHKPQANAGAGVPRHWNDFLEEFDEIKNYNKAEVLDIDYVQAVPNNTEEKPNDTEEKFNDNIRFLLHYDDDRFIVAVDGLGNPVCLLMKNYDNYPRELVEYHFASVKVYDKKLVGIHAKNKMAKKKSWWEKLGLVLVI